MSGIMPTPSPTNIRKMAGIIAPSLKNTRLKPMKAIAISLPQIPFKALEISVYQLDTSEPPVPAKAKSGLRTNSPTKSTAKANTTAVGETNGLSIASPPKKFRVLILFKGLPHVK
jgi:hypothetical protein